MQPGLCRAQLSLGQRGFPCLAGAAVLVPHGEVRLRRWWGVAQGRHQGLYGEALVVMRLLLQTVLSEGSSDPPVAVQPWLAAWVMSGAAAGGYLT